MGIGTGIDCGGSPESVTVTVKVSGPLTLGLGAKVTNPEALTWAVPLAGGIVMTKVYDGLPSGSCTLI